MHIPLLVPRKKKLQSKQQDTDCTASKALRRTSRLGGAPEGVFIENESFYFATMNL